MSFRRCISLRDDDINKFTNVENLRSWYEPIFEKLHPTLCVTPYAGEVYRQVRQHELLLQSRQDKISFVRDLYKHDGIEKIFHSIYDNRDLIDLLREWSKDRKIEIALHGITHNQTPFGFECEGDAPSLSSFLRVLEELEDVIGVKIKWFSPPNNSIKRPWMKLVKKCELNLVHSLGPKPWETDLNLTSIVELTKVAIDVFLNGRNSRLNRPLSLGNISLLQSIPLSPGMRLEQIKKNINSARKSGGMLVIATHSYAFEYAPELYQDLLDLLDYCGEFGFKAVTLQQQLDSVID
jgi:hypothetical protein